MKTPREVQQEEFQRWCDDGHYREAGTVSPILIDNFPLDQNSWVIDIGAYRGDWSIAIHNKYQSSISLYEPVEEALDYAVAKLAKLGAHISPYYAALSDKSGEVLIHLAEEGSSMHESKTSESRIIQTLDIANEMPVWNVDFVKINIEGEEFKVISRLVETGNIHKIDNLLIQCHPFGKDPDSDYDKLFEQLSQTHSLQWRYKWIWEYWTRNE